MVWPPVVCPVLPTKVSEGERERERETRVYAYGRTNKEASIGVVSGIGAEDDKWDEDGRGERSWSGREMKRADERRRERG